MEYIETLLANNHDVVHFIVTSTGIKLNQQKDISFLYIKPTDIYEFLSPIEKKSIFKQLKIDFDQSNSKKNLSIILNQIERVIVNNNHWDWDLTAYHKILRRLVIKQRFEVIYNKWSNMDGEEFDKIRAAVESIETKYFNNRFTQFAA